MIPAPSLAQLSALQGDKLEEGAMATVADVMRLVTLTSRRVDAAEGALMACKVQFDVAPFRTLRQCLDDAFDAMSATVMAHIDAVESRNT